jgi:hypothetical protein
MNTDLLSINTKTPNQFQEYYTRIQKDYNDNQNSPISPQLKSKIIN